MFSALGLAIAGSILLWVYAGFSPRNTPIIEYKGGIEIGINTLNNFSEKKEIHKYRFSGTKGQIIDINVVLESDIRFGTKFYIDNPEQMFEVLSNTTTANTNFSTSQKEEIIGKTDTKTFAANKKILLKENATYTLGGIHPEDNMPSPKEIIDLYHHKDLSHVLCVSEYDEENPTVGSYGFVFTNTVGAL